MTPTELCADDAGGITVVTDVILIIIRTNPPGLKLRSGGVKTDLVHFLYDTRCNEPFPVCTGQNLRQVEGTKSKYYCYYYLIEK